MQEAAPRRDPERRRAILQAAATAFAHAGYAATSMEDIATEAGITKLIVYRHFETKENLYREVLEQVFKRQAELFVINMAHGRQAAGTVEALLGVGREWPDGFRLLWRHAAREPQFHDYALVLRNISVTAAREVVNRLVEKPYAEWAAQTVFDHLVDAVLNWLDYGNAANDDGFIQKETAAIQSTLLSWSNPA
jgi:AcrR family transcriptional regulator